MNKYTEKELVELARGGPLATAAADALELMEYSTKGDKGEPLDLSMETYDFVAIPLMMAGVAALRAGESKAQVRAMLARKAASYELFTLCNFLQSTGEVCARIDHNLARSPHPVLWADKLCFDLYGVLEQSAEECFLFPAEGVAVDMSPARALIQEQLFEKL